MDITTLSATELKALVYDRMALIEQAQADIRALQAELAKPAQTEDEVVESDNEDF